MTNISNSKLVMTLKKKKNEEEAKIERQQERERERARETKKVVRSCPLLFIVHFMYRERILKLVANFKRRYVKKTFAAEKLV